MFVARSSPGLTTAFAPVRVRLGRKPCGRFAPAQEPGPSLHLYENRSPGLRLSYQVKMSSFWQIFSSLLFVSKCVSGWLLGGNTSGLNWGAH